MVTTTNILDRRHLLAGAAGIATAAGLGACTRQDRATGPTNPVEATRRVELPVYQQMDIAPPELPPDESGVVAGHLRYPADVVAATDELPGRDGEFTFLSQASSTGDHGTESEFWQELERRLGATINMITAPAGEYAAKFSTVIAGNDIPDAVQIRGAVPNLPDLLTTHFQDLTEYLSGDAVLKYPALATIQPATWRNAIFNGGIYGIPIHRGNVGEIMLARSDIAASAGADLEISDGEGFLALCAELTRPQQNLWALGTNPLLTLPYVLQMLGGPNVWDVHDGIFTTAYATEEYEQAIEIIRSMWEQGVFHPDAFGTANVREWWTAGRVAMLYAGYGTWVSEYIRSKESIPELEVAAVPAPRYDGGGPAQVFLDEGCYSITALRKADPDRIDELLRIANWLTAPFGTEEYTYQIYGTEGTHFNWEDGEPMATQAAAGAVMRPLYVFSPLHVLYCPGYPEVVETQHAYQKDVVPQGLPLPTLGLYSPTDMSDGAQLGLMLDDVASEIIRGNRPVSDWSGAVDEWRSSGGDQIKSEYEAAHAAAEGA